MKPTALLRLARTPHPLARIRIARDMVPWFRLQFLSTALQIGLLEALRTPKTRAELETELGVARPTLLDAMLNLGVSVKEIARRGDRYRISGLRSRALLGEGGDTLGALIQEIVILHGPAYVDLPPRLKGAPLGEPSSGDLIARASRIVEPFMQLFLEQVIERDRPLRLLEVGCGSGIYVRYAAEINPAVEGVALEVQESVARQAEANLEAWGLSKRFRVVQGDIRQAPPAADGPFDLITLHNNIYYFAPEERTKLYENLRRRLAPGGKLILVSMMQGNSGTASDLDLLLRSTRGWEPLPELGEVEHDLARAGFAKVERHKLIAWEPYYGLVCTP